MTLTLERVQNQTMATSVTIHDVPEDVLEALLRQARDRGESLQDLLLSVITRAATISRNRELIAEIRRDLAVTGGAGPDAPDAADVIRRERRGEYDA
ncbi:cell division FtsZ-interacting protein ZapD [Catenuloplanes nepalensis]|uniref:Cell division FtsZ-interacting protein ZapD n=1 Tax=Catenuloplanes nepalensis TaxID=587533 RepID=A0ABT9N147_9ACTN|nr:hypothetical protein [Catenuloplanes nepalensis]MDP9797414.1 cell division FtsZ-interacting protein ZapD [Catenuloplanes nepalensis]